jgi:hypothetical protein
MSAQSSVIDLRPTIVPKSDQLNADDLIGRSLTIRITAVKACGEPTQPIAICFDGDNGKPYKPCKSMRRVLVKVWGGDSEQVDATKFIGRSLTLYRDDKVQFGGLAVGGIRISHMSDIDRDVVMVLTESKAKRQPFTVRPLRNVPPPRQQAAPSTGTSELTLAQRADMYEERLKAAPNALKAKSIREANARLREALDADDPDRLADLESLFNDRVAFLEDAEGDAV